MIKLLNDFQLSKNFKVSEFVCPDGSGEVMIVPEQTEALQRLRDIAKAPVNIMSGYRNKTYNTKIGGDKNSNHMKGEASDIHVVGFTPEQIVPLAQLAGFSRVLIYDTFVHVGVTAGNTFHDYRVNNKNKPVFRIW